MNVRPRDQDRAGVIVSVAWLPVGAEQRAGGGVDQPLVLQRGEELARLAQLRDAGTLSDEELQAQKAKILAA
jgi:hypothetical protein